MKCTICQIRDRAPGQTRCSPCNTEYSRAWRRKNAQKWREIHGRSRLRTQYGLSPSDRAAMAQQQEGRCAICDRPKALVIDHCHRTGQVRGLLCNSCNILLGLASDDPDVLRAAIRYLSTPRV